MARRSKPLESTHQKAKRVNQQQTALIEKMQRTKDQKEKDKQLLALRGTRVKYSVRKTLFISEYLQNGFDSIKACIAVGYKPTSAPAASYYFLRDPEVLEMIEKRKEDLRKRSNITIDKLIFKLADIVDFDISDLYTKEGILKPLHEMTKETRTAIAGIESEEILAYDKLFGDKLKIGTNKKVKIVDRIRAIELLSKLLGYVDKVEVKTINGGTVNQVRNHEVLFQDNTVEDIDAEVS